MTTDDDALTAQQTRANTNSPLISKYFLAVVALGTIYTTGVVAFRLAGRDPIEQWIHSIAIGTVAVAAFVSLIAAMDARHRAALKQTMTALARERREDNDAMVRALQRVTRNQVALGQKIEGNDRHLTTAVAGLYTSRAVLADEPTDLVPQGAAHINGHPEPLNDSALQAYLLGIKDRRDDAD